MVFICSSFLSAQQNAINLQFIDAQQATQLLLGNSSGVQIFNPQFTGDYRQLGYFTNAGNHIEINEGIILSTGDARISQLHNRKWPPPCNYNNGYLNDGTVLNVGHIFGAEVSVGSSLNDDDLKELATGSIYSPAVLEFDFIPNAEGTSFEFIFASDEYNEFVGTNYNDVFGFFISGPGINGPFLNNGINLALVNNTDPISINTINNLTNAQYFIENRCAGPYTGPPANSNCFPCPEPEFQYDGFTRKLTVLINNLECTELYHIRLAISNVSDDKYGSAVFIKAGSFTNNFITGPITAMPDPVCEGQPLTLTVQGNSAYQYQWFDQDGQLVSTSQTATFPAVVNAPPYTLLVTDTESGCNKEVQVNPIVHVLENQPPYTLGINKTGQHVYYVAAGQPFSFHINSFDALNEKITTQLLNFPVEINSNIIGYITPIFDQVHQIRIVSGTVDTPGEYMFSLYLEDNNKCDKLDTTENFKIVVLCADCMGTVFYESRGLNTPISPLLPNVTSVTGQIIAGQKVDPNQSDGNVVITPQVGTVKFYASESVLLTPGYIVQPGANFIAALQPGCDDNCNDCCVEWHGFTISQSDIPNVFTPDGDGINEVWYVPDSAHSNCAFGIKGFELYIYNRWGKLVYTLSRKSENCCMYKAPGSQQPNLQYSNIFWNGQINHPSPGPMVTPGTYYYNLSLYGCNGYNETWNGFMLVAY
jgi:hypothetical protein